MGATGPTGVSLFPDLTLGTGTVTAGTLTAANRNRVEVTNAGADSSIQLIDLGVTPGTGQLLVIGVAATSTGGYAILTGGSPSGTAYPILADSSTAGPAQSIWLLFNGTAWEPELAGLSQSAKLTNNLITGGLVYQSTLITTPIGTDATVDMNATGAGVTVRLLLTGNTAAAGSISNIINSFLALTTGQRIEVVNLSPFAVALNHMAGGVGQIYVPGASAGESLVLTQGQIAVIDYDATNVLGFGANVGVVIETTGDPVVGISVVVVGTTTITAQHPGDLFIQCIVGSAIAPTLLDLGFTPLPGTVVRIASAATSTATMTLTTGGAHAGTAWPFGVVPTAGLTTTQMATGVFNGGTWDVYR